MRIRLIAPLTAALVAGTIGLTATSAAAAPAPTAAPTAAAAPATLTSTINQTIPGVGTFVGTFTPTGFARSGGQTTVTGLVQGTLTSLTGTTTPVSQTASAPVTAAQATGSCTILDLTLGPLHLDLLGLVVDLNQVHLVITAVQGPGNLLGNLLCAVANLLNGGTTGGALANLLNQLLGLLGTA
ncbi:ABC transporter substrate-binding protein [Petropleomorpha daqingensis]|uniref:ABC transporter substrate-binding protein n=1 Tax=Petropleomorpha daqingensis TaxID=2026353 RepID=A0A853CI91_9ACTN|nr:ABC transporter substrate-binding protein [Petropleomorpha daqingensis]NYJ07520.1 hypothetical protein [Petropleomorpha daqingensis]